MTPAICLLAAALAVGVPAAVTSLLWSACALAGRIDDEQGIE